MTSRRADPIVIVAYDPAWPLRFQQERDLILGTCGTDAFVRIEHIGSTAVPGLGAKPIVDIMPGLRSLADAPRLTPLLETIGYEYVPTLESDLPERRFFRKDVAGERAFHLHIVETTSGFWERHVLFRDYLRAHPEAAAAYERLKRRLAAEYGSDRVGYTDAKTEFIRSIEEAAREEAQRWGRSAGRGAGSAG